MSFGENVVYYRKELKITQEELAEKLCVSRQTVSRWENDSFFPDMDTLIKLCDLFECFSPKYQFWQSQSVGNELVVVAH